MGATELTVRYVGPRSRARRRRVGQLRRAGWRVECFGPDDPDAFAPGGRCDAFVVEVADGAEAVLGGVRTRVRAACAAPAVAVVRRRRATGAALAAGWDDAAPGSAEELRQRVGKLLARGTAPASDELPPVVVCPPLRIDRALREVTVDGNGAPGSRVELPVQLCNVLAVVAWRAPDPASLALLRRYGFGGRFLSDEHTRAVLARVRKVIRPFGLDISRREPGGHRLVRPRAAGSRGS